MADYKTTQQYAPLVAPKTWGAEEKKFIVQLTEILDDIYRRYGRLKLTDLGLELRTLVAGTITADRIDVDNLYVKHLNAADGDFIGTLIITNPSNADEQIIFGENADGDFGGFITGDNGETFTKWLNFSGLMGGAVIPGSLPNTVDAYTSLLLHFFGENDSVAFTNSSQYPQTITAAGNAKISTIQSKFGGSAGYFDGTGDYLSIPDNALYAFGSSNFTIDCWIRVPDLNPNPIASQKYHFNSEFSFYLCMGNDQHMLFQYGNADGTNSTNVVETSVTVSVNTWTHIAVVRNGETITLYVNGTSVASSTAGAASIRDSNQPVYIGTECASGSPNSYYRGYIDELRISKGIARWTANFTPPTAAYTG